MTIEEKVSKMSDMLGEECEFDICVVYLTLAQEKILTHRYPFGTSKVDVEERFENAQIELAIVLYNQRGVEGQSAHTENGITRRWRTEEEILQSIPRMADTFL